MPVNTIHASTSHWACSALAIVILLTRAILSRGTVHVSLLSKWICVVSLVIIAVRLPVVHFLMIYTLEDHRPSSTDAPNLTDVERLQIAAGLALCARILVTLFFWLQVALLLRFYARIIGHIRWARRAIIGTWALFFTSLATVILITIFECRPLHLYWSAERPKCQQARAQIFTQGIFNIVLDLALLGIVLPIIAHAQLARPQRFQVLGLLLLGIACIIVTGLKLGYVVDSESSQAMRTFWASIGVVVSTFVANMPTIVGCAGLKRPWRKLTWKMKSASRDEMYQNNYGTYHREDVGIVDMEMDEVGQKSPDIDVKV